MFVSVYRKGKTDNEPDEYETNRITFFIPGESRDFPPEFLILGTVMVNTPMVFIPMDSIRWFSIADHD